MKSVYTKGEIVTLNQGEAELLELVEVSEDFEHWKVRYLLDGIIKNTRETVRYYVVKLPRERE